MAQDDVIRDWSDLVWSGPFEPIPYYEPETDAMELFVSDEEYYGDSVSAHLLLYRSRFTDAVIGCRVSSVCRRLIPALQALGVAAEPEAITIGMLLLAVLVVDAPPDSRPSELNSRDYLDLIAPLCRTAGHMHVALPA